ncbi:serine/threonine protein kinase [Parafrankia sp. EAN1pec]|uniref:serine/threonine-protein kinase n=1 Tax=Parafrankia sp. (strain EAN1pec) TaxID=298653 RepID=UPI0000543DAD|nr:serine/threonine protein kinase [Frankia sp. EAN1pec]
MLSPLTDSDPRAIGPYRLYNRIGAGGMGIVYLGFSPDDQPVAVKVPNPQHATDPEFRARFRAEVSAARGVRGPTVARVINAEVNGPQPWLATEYVQGPSLNAAVSDGCPLVDRQLDTLAVGLAQALVAIHQAGVVHRDLKPANIVMSWSGPKVIDFGVARSADYSGYTRAGEVVGTVAWMAPEQIRGQTAGPAADVHAWALCVGFAATGRRLFRGDTQEIVALHISSTRPDLSDIPERLLGPIRAALDKSPHDRPDAQDLLTMLTGDGRRAGSADESRTARSDPDPDPGSGSEADADRTRATISIGPGTNPPPVIARIPDPRGRPVPPAVLPTSGSAAPPDSPSQLNSPSQPSFPSRPGSGWQRDPAERPSSAALPVWFLLLLLAAVGLTGAALLGAAAAGVAAGVTGPVGAGGVAAACAHALAPAHGRRALTAVLAAAVGAAGGLVLARLAGFGAPLPVLTEIATACLLASAVAVVMAGPPGTPHEMPSPPGDRPSIEGPPETAVPEPERRPR